MYLPKQMTEAYLVQAGTMIISQMYIDSVLVTVLFVRLS